MLYQWCAGALCVLVGLAMILNNQMGGEGMWFWYATLFHHGVKLYSQLHTPLQPLFVLEMSTWIGLFGSKTWVTEIPSVLHLLLLCGAMLLVLRESEWPDWQKAIVLTGVFMLTVFGHSYRFDDYHVTAEFLIFYALWALLLLTRAETERRELVLAGVLGSLAGLTITTRLTDGAALFCVNVLCLLVFARRRRTAAVLLTAGCAVAVVLLLVLLSGDSFADYISSTVFKAAASKGGTGSIFAAPGMLFINAVTKLRAGGKWLVVWTSGIVLLGAVLARWWRRGLRFEMALQLAGAGVGFVVCSQRSRGELLDGSLLTTLVLVLTVLTYVLGPVVVVRALMARRKGSEGEWDARELLVLLPLAEWASYAAGAAGEPLTNFYAPVAMLLLLVPVLQPFRRWASWANTSFVTVLLLIAASGITSKYRRPYSWQNYIYSPMFTQRVWYRHPVYGPLYIDQDELAFSQQVCGTIGGMEAQPELLSLPYPYPNYFCATPPWHGYVQTFFDTSTRPTIEKMMRELETDPPKWIVYQRQMKIMTGMEKLYNHGKPIAQRDLDSMIFEKISSGQWTLVRKLDYLPGDGWYIIRTRP